MDALHICHLFSELSNHWQICHEIYHLIVSIGTDSNANNTACYKFVDPPGRCEEPTTNSMANKATLSTFSLQYILNHMYIIYLP